jgi:hypothetical protein
MPATLAVSASVYGVAPFYGVRRLAPMLISCVPWIVLVLLR